MTFPSRTTSLISTATAALASGVMYPFLSERVATHFDAEGNPDRYSSRTSAAVTLPAVMGGLALVNDRLGAWPGGRDREDGDAGAGARDQAIGMVELAILPSHLALLANGAGVPVDMGRLNRAVFGTLLIALGNVMPKLPRNGLVGIRTPWTMADPTVWERTHRAGGYFVTVAGLVGLASLPLSGKRAARISGVAVLGAVGLSVVYSFVAYVRRER